MIAVVTGAAGFAGYSFTIELLNRGYRVHAILRPGSEHNKRFSDITDSEKLLLHEVDCNDFDKISDSINESCDVFYHLAWFGARDDFEGQNKNIIYTIKALESAGKLGCKRFVGIGSQAEYGVCKDVITEDLTPAPINAYGAAKVAALYLSKRRAEQLGVEWIWGRIFSLYGLYEPKGRMLPDLVDSIKRGETKHLSSCEQYWDYLNVLDASKAIAAIGEKGHNGEIYNIANGDYKALKEFVEEIRTTLNPDCHIVYGDRANPFISLKTDISKIRKHTGWYPEIPFMEGIRQL